MMMDTNDVREILETLAIHHATDRGQHGLAHGSRLAKLETESWQADAIRNAAEIKQAKNATELRELMEDGDVAVVFLPRDAFVTADIIERICCESPFNKTIIWETNS